MGFRRRIGAERTALMLPFNVVMVGRVRGRVDPAAVAGALESLRWRHPLLAVRVETDSQGTAWFSGDDVPVLPTRVEPRLGESQWLDCVKDELRRPFSLETGPLVRCAVVHSPDVSEIALCAQHAICDGMSLGYLLRDLLQALTGSSEGLEERLEAPAVGPDTVSPPRRTNPLGSLVIGRVNRRWAAKNVSFSAADMRRLQAEFWRRNGGMQALAWIMEATVTSALIARCRAERVTVNAALWAAFLAAQHEMQGGDPRYRRRAGMAVNTRDKLTVPVGEVFGFYASSLTVDLPYDPAASFWDNARWIRSRIARELVRTDLFRMLSAEAIHPTLLDALYFAKYGLLDEAIPRRALRRMRWHEVSYGYALTNVGRFDIPVTYDPLQLTAVYGPAVYSDVAEKVVGAITVGGRLSCIMTFDGRRVDGRALLAAAKRRLEEAAQGPGPSGPS